LTRQADYVLFAILADLHPCGSAPLARASLPYHVSMGQL
jgi:hypothetical protein